MHKRLHLQHITTGDLILGTAESHYLRDVLRLQVGASVLVFDGAGKEAMARVTTCSRREVVLTVDAGGVISESLSQQQSVILTVGVAQPKGQRADWLVEKLTELGVARIVWLTCQRSVSQSDAQGQRSARWQRLIEAAAQQCRRSRLPALEGPESLAVLMARPASYRLLAAPGGAPLVPWANSMGASSLKLSAQQHVDIVIAIGPEGGFTPEETAIGEQAGAVQVAMGPHILRTETAAMAAAAVMMSAL